jgi:rhodanese-related sulfurtransferase
MSEQNAISVADVLRNVDTNLFMCTGDWLQAQLATDAPPSIVDLRDENSFRKGHIAGSLHIPLRSLPDKAEAALRADSTVVCVCNGSVQSAMAVVFLRTVGYKKAFNLSGGLSAWERQGKPLETSSQSAGNGS